MRYLIKKNFFFSEFLTIQDLNQKDVFFIKHKFSLSSKFLIQDQSRNNLLEIKRKFFSFWKPTYIVKKAGQLYAKITREPFNISNEKYFVEYSNGEIIEINGNFLDYDYEFTKNSKIIARVSKSFFSFTDKYGIETAENQDDPMIIATIIVIDKVTEERERNQRNKQRQRTISRI